MMKIVIKGSTEASEFNVNAALQITGERREAETWLCACMQTLQKKNKLSSKRKMLEGTWRGCLCWGVIYTISFFQ